LKSQEKQQGYENALKEANIPFDEKYIVEGDNEIEGGYLAAKKLLKLTNPPQAVFAANDLMAIGAIEAIKSEGLTVPGNVAIVGFDDIKCQ
jgi:LacI family transcriptional regulator